MIRLLYELFPGEKDKEEEEITDKRPAQSPFEGGNEKKNSTINYNKYLQNANS